MYMCMYLVHMQACIFLGISQCLIVGKKCMTLFANGKKCFLYSIVYILT